MSFETSLNYAAAVDGLNQQITELQTQSAANSTSAALLQSSPYAGILSADIAFLESLILSAGGKIANYNILLDEIARIQALSQPEKDLIYYFYSILGVRRNYFMAKLLFNTEALVDENVMALYADVVTAPEVKLLVAKLLFDKFAIDSRYSELYDVKAYLA